jgi:hypothetical protein
MPPGYGFKARPQVLRSDKRSPDIATILIPTLRKRVIRQEEMSEYCNAKKIEERFTYLKILDV